MDTYSKPVHSSRFTEIRECEHGKGTYATQFIPAYTIILIESPLCTHINNTDYTFTQYAHDKILKLHHESTTDPVLDAFRMNAFQISRDVCAVYYRASRVNHCCISNCHVNFRGNVLYLYTMQPIQKGDPITINYMDNYLMSYGLRTYRLKRSWNFECQCVLCSDTHRRQLYDKFVFAAANSNTQIADLMMLFSQLRIPRTHVIARKVLSQVCCDIAWQRGNSKRHIDFHYSRCIRGFNRSVHE